MWIGSYKLSKNVHPPHYINEYIHQHVDDLYQKIKREMSGQYTVVLDKSKVSESCYLSIFKDGKEIRISFRNHDGSEKLYNYGVYLWKFKTWYECEKYFVKRIFPTVLANLVKY